MIRLRVSYKSMDELSKLLNLLGHSVSDMKLAPAKGEYKRAYIKLIDLENAEIERDND